MSALNNKEKNSFKELVKTLFVAGSIAIWPEVYRVFPVITAWLYGPIGVGAKFVWMIFFIIIAV